MNPSPPARVVSRGPLRLAWTPQTASPTGLFQTALETSVIRRDVRLWLPCAQRVSDLSRDPDLDGASMLLCGVPGQLSRWPSEGWVSTRHGTPLGAPAGWQYCGCGPRRTPAKAQWLSRPEAVFFLPTWLPPSSRTPAPAPGSWQGLPVGSGLPLPPTGPPASAPPDSLRRSGLTLLLWFPREASDSRQLSVWAPPSSLTRPPPGAPGAALQQERVWEEAGVSAQAHWGPLLVWLWTSRGGVPATQGARSGCS